MMMMKCSDDYDGGVCKGKGDNAATMSVMMRIMVTMTIMMMMQNKMN